MNKPGTQRTTHTGATITYTKTGLIHKAGKKYSGQIAEMDKDLKKKS